MFKTYQKTKIAALIIVLILMVVGVWQFFILQKAHSTFENYYAFRGCTQLLTKTDATGTCQLASGEVITIVKINDKWYLEGDGPGIW